MNRLFLTCRIGQYLLLYDIPYRRLYFTHMTCHIGCLCQAPMQHHISENKQHIYKTSYIPKSPICYVIQGIIILLH